MRIEGPLVRPARPNEICSAEFMSIALWSRPRFPAFKVIDDFNREARRIEIDTSLSARAVIRVLDELVAAPGKPSALRLDKRPRLISEELEMCASASCRARVHFPFASLCRMGQRTLQVVDANPLSGGRQ